MPVPLFLLAGMFFMRTTDEFAFFNALGKNAMDPVKYLNVTHNRFIETETENRKTSPFLQVSMLLFKSLANTI